MGKHYNVGKNHWNWKDGISTLEGLIRQLDEYKIWRNEVTRPYICSKCNSMYLIEAYHIKPFSKILKEFIEKYNQFSPIDDKETLVRLAITYESFWDIKNGKALCVKCHNETKGFRERDEKGKFK